MSLADFSDEELMFQYKSGALLPFEELVRRHRRAVFHFALRSLNNPAAAEDALQEIFLRVVKYAPQWEQKAKFKTWLFTIARNHCIDEARKNVFRRTESLDAPLTQEEGSATRGDMVASTDAGADQNAHANRVRVVLDAAVAKLPEEQREVFLMREHSDIQFKDIAQIMNVSENTVKSRMRYALESIRKELLAKGITPP